MNQLSTAAASYEIAHAVGEQKDSPSLVASRSDHRLEGGEARDMEGRAAGLALVPQIIFGEKRGGAAINSPRDGQLKAMTVDLRH